MIVETESVLGAVETQPAGVLVESHHQPSEFEENSQIFLEYAETDRIIQQQSSKPVDFVQYSRDWELD